MLRVSLFFVLIAGAAFFAADITVTTLDPWIELKNVGYGFLVPDFSQLPRFGRALLNTVSFALIGIVLAVIFGSLLSLFFESRPVRLFCAFIRAIHEIFWAFLFMPLVGLNSTCGILAIAVPYAGVFAKVYAEIRQESDRLPAQALPPATSRLSSFLYTGFPRIYHDLKNYTAYRFECALRSSAILGFIGLPTLGYHLETAFREGMYSEAAALLYCFYLLIILLKFWTRPYVLIPLLLIAVLFTSWETTVSLENIIRFFTYDILPWPMRADGFYTATQAITFEPLLILEWMKTVILTEALPGMWNTLVLTQIALVGTALFTLVVFPFASRRFFGKKVTSPVHLLLVVLRTTPEYILAYLFLQLWGPSMLPAIFALFLHNGAILSFLTAKNVNLLQLPFDVSRSRFNRYCYEVVPRCYGQLMAFLFYRWEVIMRESAILGILGIYTLGHYVDSAISMDHLDTAVLLIICTALINMTIDSISWNIRKRVKISSRLNI